jgi:hypothetical protein
MMTLQTLYETKQITRTDFLAGKLYYQIRRRVLRSKSIQNTLHESSTHKLLKTKGHTIDPYQSAELENFWDRLEDYFKFDPHKPLTILDFITGLRESKMHISVHSIKTALKQINKILKHTDIINIMR